MNFAALFLLALGFAQTPPVRVYHDRNFDVRASIALVDEGDGVIVQVSVK